MVGSVKDFALVLAVLAGAALPACGGAPEPRTGVASTHAPLAPAPVAKAPSLPGDCEQEPEPLERVYKGVAANARCQREVYTIMSGVTGFLGVKCNYCHLVPDYKAMTHRKEIANWMASELIPTLQRKKDGAQPWCNNCHTADGKGVAKILGDPRRPAFAMEWMTTHLVEDFQTKTGNPLHCKSCHQGNVGTPEFQRQVILTKHLPAD
ncbi:MAG: hypothetical protein ABJB12_19325 [Pseudomonadota bacterium]